jgi:hypothetical protein
MQKLILLSLLFANVAIPMVFAGDPDGRRGVRRTVTSILVTNCIYLLTLIFVYPQLAE